MNVRFDTHLNGRGKGGGSGRIADLFASGAGLPEGVGFTRRVIYYVGPVDPVRDEVGAAGRSDYRDPHGQVYRLHARAYRLARDGRKGGARARRDRIDRRHGAAYLMAVGGAAYLVSKAIRGARVVAFSYLGMEAIYEFVVSDMPVTVAVDARGEWVHSTGSAVWSSRIRTLGIPVRVA